MKKVARKEDNKKNQKIELTSYRINRKIFEKFYAKDVKQFIKEIIDEIEMLKKEWESVAPEYRRTTQEEEIIEDLANLILIIKQKCGKELKIWV